MRVTIYISNLNLLGGVETFVHNFLKRMSKHLDLTLLYDNVDATHLLIRASNYANVEKIDKSKIHECDVFICSTFWGFHPYNNIKAKKIIQVIHADYRRTIIDFDFKYIKHPKVTHHVCVSKTVKEGFETVTPYKCDAVIYNLLNGEVKEIEKKKNKILKLVTVSRFSKEKGFARMNDFVSMLKCDYEWHIFGNTSKSKTNIIPKLKDKPNIFIHGVTLESQKEMAKADYLLALSDTEGFSYSIIESLQVGTPVIVTDFPSAREVIKDKINGYVVDFDLKFINFDSIINNIPTFEPYKDISSENDWLKIIN